MALPPPHNDIPQSDAGAKIAHGRLNAECVFWSACTLVIVTLYFYRLGQVPVGLHQDEASVGWNARTLLRHGTDQYGVPHPLFFRAFDDYKSPLLVYAVAASEAVLGPKAYAVRLPSALFALATAVAMYFLLVSMTARASRPSGRAQLARWMSLALLASPTSFMFGRTACTEASTLPFVFVVALIALHGLATRKDAKSAAWSGFTLALTAYCYTTMRLLAPLTIVAAVICFSFDRGTRRHVPALFAVGALTLLPYALYLVDHPGALQHRFNLLSIFYDRPPADVALGRFANHYLLHLSPQFLFGSGDPNPRQSFGNGLLPLWLAAPLIGGIYVLWCRRREPFCAFLLVTLLLSPVAAALTHFEIPHASRMLAFLPLAFAVAAIGVDTAWTALHPNCFVLALLVLVPSIESGVFFERYFKYYPAVSQMAFDEGRSAALDEAFEARRPGQGVGLPRQFLQYGGIWVAFAGDYDAAEVHVASEPNWTARLSDITLLTQKGPRMARGSVLVTAGRAPPAQAADRLRTVDALADGAPLWTVWRAR